MKFYDHPYRSFFKSRGRLAASYGLDPARKWVLFPENYRWAFLSDGQIKSFLAQDARSDYLTAAREYCIRSFSRLCEWLQELDGPDDPIVILRPRPATATDLIEGFMRRAAPRGCPNVRVIKSESAREWILAADHVISSYSTTLIEAALAQKPVHLFSPEPFPEALLDEWYAHVPKLENREDLISAIRRPHRAANSGRLGEWARNALLPAGDPIQLIAEQLARLCPTRQLRGALRKPHHLTLVRSMSERIRKWLQRSERYHEHLRRRDPRYAFTVQKHEKDVFSAHDVIARISRWQLAAEQPPSENRHERLERQSPPLEVHQSQNISQP